MQLQGHCFAATLGFRPHGFSCSNNPSPSSIKHARGPVQHNPACALAGGGGGSANGGAGGTGGNSGEQHDNKEAYTAQRQMDVMPCFGQHARSAQTWQALWHSHVWGRSHIPVCLAAPCDSKLTLVSCTAGDATGGNGGTVTIGKHQSPGHAPMCSCTGGRALAAGLGKLDQHWDGNRGCAGLAVPGVVHQPSCGTCGRWSSTRHQMHRCLPAGDNGGGDGGGNDFP